MLVINVERHVKIDVSVYGPINAGQQEFNRKENIVVTGVRKEQIAPHY